MKSRAHTNSCTLARSTEHLENLSQILYRANEKFESGIWLGSSNSEQKAKHIKPHSTSSNTTNNNAEKKKKTSASQVAAQKKSTEIPTLTTTTKG